MADGTPFFDVTDSGRVKIYTKRLATILIGILAAPSIQGAMNLIDTLFDAFLINPIAFVGALAADFVDAIIPNEAVRLSFQPLIEWIGSLGVLAYPVAIGAVLLLAYIVVVAREVADG